MSFDRFAEAAIFEPGSGVLEIFDEPTVDLGAPRIEGHYARLGGRVLVFYRDRAGELRLWCDGHSVAADETTVRWRHEDPRSLFTVGDEAATVVDVSYRVRLEEDDPAPFVDTEDADVGLFVWNVVSDPGRRGRIYRDHDQ